MLLREIEVKMLEYQDDLESGKRKMKSGWSITEQLAHFRRKLLKKAEKQESDSMSERYESSSSKREAERSPSPMERKANKRSRKVSSSPEPVISRHANRRGRSRSISPPSRVKQ